MIRLFYSYAHEDEPLRDQLQKHLSALKREGVISEWHDRRIHAGQDWEPEIEGELERSDVILVLLSADFVASEYCTKEVEIALRRHVAGEAKVIPVILRPVDWSGPTREIQALPRDGRPVTSWENPDEAFLDIARGIRKAVAELRGEDAPRVEIGQTTSESKRQHTETPTGSTRSDLEKVSWYRRTKVQAAIVAGVFATIAALIALFGGRGITVITNGAGSPGVVTGKGDVNINSVPKDREPR